MSQLVDDWNNNIDNYDRDREVQLNAGIPYLVHTGLECHSIAALYWNIYKLEIGNLIYDGSLF